MPSLQHDALLLLLRNRPSLAVDLLRGLNVPTPAFDAVEMISADLTQVLPIEFRADAVLKLCGPPPERRPLLGLILEHQRSRNLVKRRSWPVYVTVVAAELGCPACLLVVAPDDRVAAWAARPIVVGPGTVVRPFVIGPSGIPRVEDPDTVDRAPELATLSAMVHGRADSADSHAAVKVVLEALAAKGGETRLLYCELIWNHLGPALRGALESFMYNLNLPLKSPIRRAIEETEARAKAEGWAEGLAEGKAEGKAEGETAGEAQSLLIVLGARGIAVSKAARLRILACSDPRELTRWLRRAATARTLAEVFAPESR
jgi:hypothetical protein